MHDRMKQRLVGAVVLVLAAVIFVPILLDRNDVAPQPRAVVEPPPNGTPVRDLPLEGNAMPATSRPAEPAPRRDAPVEAAVSKSTPKTSAATPGFAVQLGSFSKSENARGLRDMLLAKGYAAFVRTTGSVTRVYVGPQSSRAEAEKMLEKLLAETKLKGIVVKHSG